MKTLLELILNNPFECLLILSLIGGIITGSIAIYYNYQITKIDMENGYIQKTDGYKTIWVKKNAN